MIKIMVRKIPLRELIMTHITVPLRPVLFRKLQHKNMGTILKFSIA